MSRDRLQEAAERLASVFIGAGFPRMSARVLMALMVSTDGALTAAELRERLGVSAAAVSGAVTYLESLGMLRRLPHAGTRRDRYELPAEAWYTASLRSTPVYDAIRALLPDAIAAARSESADAAAERLAEMQEFFEFLRARMPQLLEEWRARRGER
ncbi:GbsR/MarR family transcriptional regulator [Gryllotalpicola ginsengisoli]|uniref:GbsR/MarR family transcriptional regulator n=1 Tax=Gryllotalpicola ginsengisoli TaxID=444608 RepID=UPI0003B32A10|nr:helix-turn-helix domain-containing protein [Gryllotalpicola ginsengisoli]